MTPVSIAELRKHYRKRTPLETLAMARPDGSCFLRFVFQRGRKQCYHDAGTFSAANDADAAAIADSLQYQILNGDLLATLESAPEVITARVALENKIGRLLEGVAEGTTDVVFNRKVGFSKETMEPLLFLWAATEKNAYRPRYEPELTALMDASNRALDAAHPDWRTPPEV